jgi:dihydrolipoamide dehydrogenase
MKTYDLIVLGGGPAGYVAAAEAGKLGKSVLLVEEGHLGGVCLNAGCIPTKTLLNTSKQYHHLRTGDVKGLALSSQSVDWGKAVDWEQAMAWKDKVVLTYRKGIDSLLKTAKVEIIQGRGRFLDRSTIEVAGQSGSGGADPVGPFKGGSILIATGSRPAVPPIPGLADCPVALTSTKLLQLKTIPRRLVVIGGGVIGLEFGAMYAQLGAKVDVVEMLPGIVPFLEPEVRRGLQRALAPIDFHLNARVDGIETLADGSAAVLFTDTSQPAGSGNPPDGGQPSQGRIEADLVLVATGRRANIEDLGLDAAGVKTSKGYILVNDHMETSAPRIYAAGDVTGTSLFAHSASRMAEVAVQVMGGRRTAVMDYKAIPWAVYTWPEAAGCGITEAQAVSSGRQVRTAQLTMRPSARFYAENENQPSLVKAVADQESGELLGVQMLGAACSEMIWGATMAVQLGLTASQAARTIFPHPTAGEVLRDVFLKLAEGENA